MAKSKVSGASDNLAGNGAGQVVVPSTRVEVLNLSEMRAARAARRAVIVDQHGAEHDLSGLSLDAYLAILEIETDFEGMAADEKAGGKVGRPRQIALIRRMEETIKAVLPEFPVGDLYLEELYAVAQAVQRAVIPGKLKENAADGEPGKST